MMKKGEKQSCICMDRAEGEQVTSLHSTPLFFMNGDYL